MEKHGAEFGELSAKQVRKIQEQAKARVDNERATRGPILDEQMRERQFRRDAVDSADGMNSGELRRAERAHR